MPVCVCERSTRTGKTPTEAGGNLLPEQNDDKSIKLKECPNQEDISMDQYSKGKENNCDPYH